MDDGGEDWVGWWDRVDARRIGQITAGAVISARISPTSRAPPAVVGDDFERNKGGGELAPETWTHGSSEQRMPAVPRPEGGDWRSVLHWVSVGRNTGLLANCNTFAAG